MQTTNIAPNSGNQERERAGGLLFGIIRLLMFIASTPFLAIRQLYWWLDTDAAVRANGVETVGTVLDTKTETKTIETECGTRQVTEHFVTYRYETPERSYTARKKVRALGGLKKDSKVAVYYRTPTDRPFQQQDTALDWNPRRID